ncbi:hypothetical protein BHQ21_19980 [Mycobacterium sherrisii]|uniref:DUF6542 domain-containing protein n=1 Tax=Mycobacterium sherrisii TaxID=243061 RepID=A0A1E3SNS5_9MYCO|nr:DUF6542 domain-containing protein [Mycobacterium sherrisii]ODR03790.1 hypothetical protein BHQ21_19980 [Mycobacterium sherrisii]
MSAQRGTSAVEAAHRSAHPNIPGVPWWIALLIAVTGTAVGYGIDSGAGHKELTGVFACLYIAGCVAAVLAVRQDGLFTAVIQPPLILFCAVPGAYWLFHGAKIGSLKDLLINCGYPLIERFPLMLGTAGGVLLIGLIRWYFAAAQRTAAKNPLDTTNTEGTEKATERATVTGSSFLQAISAKLNSLLGVASPEETDDDAEDGDSGRRPARGGAKSGRPARGSRSGTARSRSRHVRPSPQDDHDPAAERPRRRRQPPPRDLDPADPPRRSARRRPRPLDEPDPRGQSPRDSRRDPRDPRGRRSPYDRPAPRTSRFDDPDRYEPPLSRDSYRRHQSYDPYDSYQRTPEPRRRPAASGTNGADSTHHPISQVRYRAAGASGPPEEHRVERRGRPRANPRSPGRPPADSWEYDV